MKGIFLFLLIHPFAVFSAATAYSTPAIPPPNSGVKFFVPYTFGTHVGDAKMFSGKVFLDLGDPAKTQGTFAVPISSLTTGKDERDCHMREALGLDYAEADFPEVHVCNDNNELPTSGKNAVKYPEIRLKIHSIKSLDPSKIINSDRETNIEVDGEWNIHGKSYTWTFPLKLVPEGNKFRVRGEVSFSLKNHDVTVKSTKVLFMDVSVKDIIKVNFDLLLEVDPNQENLSTRVPTSRLNHEPPIHPSSHKKVN